MEATTKAYSLDPDHGTLQSGVKFIHREATIIAYQFDMA